MFIVAVVQGVEVIIFPPLRSIQSKVVDVADQGKEYDTVVFDQVALTLVCMNERDLM